MDIYFILWTIIQILYYLFCCSNGSSRATESSFSWFWYTFDILSFLCFFEYLFTVGNYGIVQAHLVNLLPHL